MLLVIPACSLAASENLQNIFSGALPEGDLRWKWPRWIHRGVALNSYHRAGGAAVLAAKLVTTRALKPAQLEQFRRLSTCLVASAIETFRVRLPNTGFADSSIRCIFEDQPAMAGYAATARLRGSNPRMEAGKSYDYYDRTDWWNNILTIPAPRVVVIEDVDDPPGLGAFVGEVHANILLALGCIGIVTNGAVRDLPDIRPTEFQMFAGTVSVSHAYAHIFDFGGAIEVGGMKVQPGDLIHGDCHGVQTVPLEIADKVPGAAREIQHRRQDLIGLRRSADFTVEKLRQAIRDTVLDHQAAK